MATNQRHDRYKGNAFATDEKSDCEDEDNEVEEGIGSEEEEF